MYYYFPILYVSYLMFNPIVCPMMNYLYYKTGKLYSDKYDMKNFKLNTIDKGNVLVYTSNEKMNNKILDKIHLEPKSEDYIFIDINQYINSDVEEIVIVSTDIKKFTKQKINKIDIDYIIIDCNKHIVFKESVFEEFFKYTGIDKDKFYKMYNKYENIVLDLKQNEIFSFT